MLPFRLFHNKGALDWPFSLYSCGLHPQHPIYRPTGYPTFQCMICFGGTGSFHFDQKPHLQVKKGDIILIPSKVPHDYSPSGEEPWVLGYMGIDGGYVESLMNTLQLPILHPIAVQDHALEFLENEIRQLWQLTEDGEDKDLDRLASTKIYSILTYIAAIRHRERPKKPYRSNAGAKEVLRAAVQYMEQHYMEDVSMANIAYSVGYSKQHFQRKFKEIYGINPSRYLRNLRLLKAMELLDSDLDATIGEIASMVGMDLNYFVRMFKREYGMTPAQYRLSIRKKER